ncbi:hypothetical protein QBC38DRAFT_41135 [Podospora fimiseda]|uniref:Uncharacterized protein n=1 Tax=Podospora fimiseda TaxID=252190 RepID=A0AAN7H2Q9_9PEZI|nr:hypothetical protein QBC38DRAFT_41135 [Podospora fimiseda]
MGSAAKRDTGSHTNYCWSEFSAILVVMSCARDRRARHSFGKLIIVKRLEADDCQDVHGFVAYGKQNRIFEAATTALVVSLAISATFYLCPWLFLLLSTYVPFASICDVLSLCFGDSSVRTHQGRYQIRGCMRWCMSNIEGVHIHMYMSETKQDCGVPETICSSYVMRNALVTLVFLVVFFLVEFGFWSNALVAYLLYFDIRVTRGATMYPQLTSFGLHVYTVVATPITGLGLEKSMWNV